jgi:hypothetical protein
VITTSLTNINCIFYCLNPTIEIQKHCNVLLAFSTDLACLVIPVHTIKIESKFGVLYILIYTSKLKS